MMPRALDIGDIVRTPQGELGYIDGVTEHGEWRGDGIGEVVWHQTQAKLYSYAIVPFSGRGKCAWWDAEELTLVHRGPVFEERKKYPPRQAGRFRRFSE
jgi:hypothetical protein